jgi:hypothetical protein
MIDLEALGGYAEQLKSNPAYQHALTIIKADLFDQFSRGTIWNGRRKREHIYLQMQAVQALEDKINNLISNSKAMKTMNLRQERMSKVRSVY